MARDGQMPSVGEAPAELATLERVGLGRVAEIQRTRILFAMAEVVSERGVADASVGLVVQRAGVSRRTFYELFQDRKDCFLATSAMAIARASVYVSSGCDPAAKWSERIRGGLEDLLCFVEHEPVLGRLVIVESLAAGTEAMELRRRAIERLVAVVDEGRESINGRGSATALTAEGIVGGVVSVIHGRLVSGDHERLGELANPLMSMIVLPYLGHAAARRELEWTVPRASVRVPPPARHPFKDLDMRLTYRTVRALAAVAANPRSSNRAIGDEAGIDDQGQVSKLLARLEKLGLIENMRVGVSNGAANVWTLTERGGEVASVIASQAAVS